MASVASFFVSRIDSAVDALSRRSMKTGAAADQARLLEGLLGKVAIANAKLAYQSYKTIFSGAALGGAGRQGRPDAARALGQHRHQEPAATATSSTSRS